MQDTGESRKSSNCPEGYDPDLWRRYLQGARAIDDVWAKGERCPGNPEGLPCKCAVPKETICRYWWAIADIAAKLGKPLSEFVKHMK